MTELYIHANRWKPERSAALEGSRIMVVEDEVLIAMEIQATLEDGGAEVLGPYHTLASALDCADHEHFSAAVLDMRIGRDSITPVARRLMARGIPFLFYSGQPLSDPVRAEWPNSLTISKPASANTLIQAVASLLESDSRTAARG